MSILPPGPVALDDGFYRMTPLELATGWLTGVEAGPAGGGAGRPKAPMEVLEALLRQGLGRPPCVVAFSGGRDSSALLAVASGMARREGWEPPVAASLRYPAVPAAQEDDWQEMVIRHLGLQHWERIAIHDELDLLGPVATAQLRRHGVLWPPGLHTRAPLLALAGGGTLVTGEGGDEVFGDRRVRAAAQLLSVRRLPGRRDLRNAAAVTAPRRVRRARLEAHFRRGLTGGWLRPDARAAVTAALVADELDEPLRWRAGVPRIGRTRALVEGLRNMRLAAALHDVEISHPFLHHAFLRALGSHGPRLGFAGRTAAMQALFGHLLPREVLARETKARFNEAVVGPHSRAFVDRWSGRGVPGDLVDGEALLRAWSAPVVPAQSLGLLQAAWVAEELR